MTYTAIIAPPDEEGFSIVAIVEANYGETDGYTQVFDRFSIRSDQVDQWVAQELAILNGPSGDCEHGLSAALCSGPQHY